MLYQVITDGQISESYGMPDHDDTHHITTAKRNIAGGVAGLDLFGYVEGISYSGINDTLRSTVLETYVKLKETSLDSVSSGFLYISFEGRITMDSTGSKAKIYRNGGAVGTEQSVINSTWGTYEEVISGWSSTDTLEVWAHKGGFSGGIEIKNLKFEELILSYTNVS